MKLQNSNQLCALIVGSPADSFFRYAVDQLGQKDIRFIAADDVYQAAAILAKENVNDLLIIGSLGQLSKERGRLFDMIAEKQLSCCCLDDAALPKARLVAANAHATILAKATELGNIIDNRFGQTFDAAVTTRQQRDSDFTADKFRTTKEELDALLGV